MASKKNEALATATPDMREVEVVNPTTGTALAPLTAAMLARDPLAGVLEEGDELDVTGTEELQGTARIPSWAFNLSTINDENGQPKPVLKTMFVNTVTGETREKLSLQVVTVHVSRAWTERVDGKSVRKCSSWDRVTGRMDDGTERGCAQCPDYAWSKDANGKNKRKCGDVNNVFSADLETADVTRISLKKTALRPWGEFYSRHFSRQRTVIVTDPKTGKPTTRKVDLPFFARETIVTLRLVTKDGDSWAEPVFKVGPILSRDHVLMGAQVVRDYRDTFMRSAAVIDVIAEEGDSGGGREDSSFDFGENRKTDVAADGMR